MARITVLGMSGTGKSWYAGAVLEDVVPNFDVAVHFDPEDEETGLVDGGQYDPLYHRFEVDPGDLASVDWRKFLYKYRKVQVVPSGLTGEEIQDLFATIAWSVLVLCRNHGIESGFLSCDEAHNVVPNHDIDDRVDRLITGGRKHGAETLYISQRPQLLHETCITQADIRVYFGISGSNDIKKINRSSQFNANRLKQLQAREAIVENKNSGEIKQIDTNTDIKRKRPHHADDDGIADDAFPV